MSEQVTVPCRNFAETYMQRRERIGVGGHVENGPFLGRIMRDALGVSITSSSA
jgi:hypothetical protein